MPYAIYSRQGKVENRQMFPPCLNAGANNGADGTLGNFLFISKNIHVSKQFSTIFYILLSKLDKRIFIFILCNRAYDDEYHESEKGTVRYG